jgi:hypothetical protein
MLAPVVVGSSVTKASLVDDVCIMTVLLQINHCDPLKFS